MKNMKERLNVNFASIISLELISYSLSRYSSHVGIILRVSCLPESSHYIGLQVSKQIPTPAFKKILLGRLSPRSLLSSTAELRQRVLAVLQLFS